MGLAQLKKIKFDPYIPASVPGPSPAHEMSATVPKKWTQKAGQWTTSQDNGERKSKALTFSEKLKITNYMCTHQLSQKQTTNYWQENSYQHRVSQLFLDWACNSHSCHIS